MPQLRQDPATKEWVIIATERAKRPHDFKMEKRAVEVPEFVTDCPFCPGNESMTPPEVSAYRLAGTANSPNWLVRVVPNKFAALIPSGSIERREEFGLFRWMDGIGHHEVIIETPLHNEFIPRMDDEHLEQILLVYRQRYNTLKGDPHCKLIIIFKNQGRSAGTSLEHPHSQLVATPIVPSSIRKKLEEATRYYDDTGRCVYCDMIREGLVCGKRVIMETEKFAVFHPFASRFPFETLIFPKQHHASFGLIPEEDLKQFAEVLKEVLGRLLRGLSDPDFNYVIHTAPVKDEEEDYYHWHLQVVPRLTTPAGFEMGSGMYINVALPEETAEFLRNLRS
jgi:UDPglucose--hexose-1-phosphate uridylyltransferase